MGNHTVAAKSLGVPRETLYRWIEHYGLQQAMEDAREERIDMYESLLDRRAREGSDRCITFFLSTMGKNRGYVPRSELSGVDGEPIMVQFGVGLEEEEEEENSEDEIPKK